MDNRSRFERAHAFVARWEGGYVDHPDDPGGVTSCGISLRALRGMGLELGDLDGDGDIDADDIRAMTPERAAVIMRRNYWDPLQLDRLPGELALVLYDTAVNMGPGTARRMAQAALGVTVDGIWGPKTWAALLACRAERTARAVIRERRGRYTALLVAHPEMKSFYLGWQRRLHALERELITY